MIRWIVLGLILLLPGVFGCGRGASHDLILLEDLPPIGRLEIEGNQVFSSGDLKKLMILKEPSWNRLFKGSKYSEHQLNSDISAILNHYLRHGYLRARLVSKQTSERNGKMDVLLRVYEGEPITTHSVSILDWFTPSAEPLRELGIPVDDLRRGLQLGPGKAFDPIRLEEDRRRLVAQLADRGYLQAQASLNVQLIKNRALIFFRVLPGDTFTVGRVEVAGLNRVSESVASQDLEVKSGDLFRRNRMISSQQNMQKSFLYSSVRWDTAAVYTDDNVVDLVFNVRERRMNWIEGGVGINSDKQVRLSAEWGTRSLFRTGLRFMARSSTELDIDEPYLVERNLLEVLVNKRNLPTYKWEFQPSTSWEYIRRSNYNQNILSLAIAERRELGRRSQVVFNIENRWVFNDADSTAIADDPSLGRDHYQTRVIGARLRHDTRSDFFNPVAGGYQQVTLEQAGGVLGGNSGFRKATLGAAEFWLIDPRGGVFGLRMEGGVASPTSTGIVDTEAELIPPEDRYRIGGAYSVRGFRESELNGRTEAGETLDGGVVQLMANVEGRWAFWGKLEAALFVDAGNVWQNSSDVSWTRFQPHTDRSRVDPRDVRYAYGAGVRLNTPVGPFRLDYAKKWNIPEALDERETSRWHLALGHAF